VSETPELAFRAYMRAFETLDPEAALPFYHLPSIFVSSQGVFAVPDEQTARALMSQFMGQLRSQSYQRTEVVGLTVWRLSPDLASCSGVFVRFDTQNDEIARLGFTYTLRHAQSWKIAVAIVHAPQPELR